AFMQGSKVTVELRHIMMKRLMVTGSTLRASPLSRKAEIAASLREKVWPLFESGKLRTVIHQVFPLSDAAAAHRLMESSAHIGKIMLEVAPAPGDRKCRRRRLPQSGDARFSAPVETAPCS